MKVHLGLALATALSLTNFAFAKPITIVCGNNPSRPQEFAVQFSEDQKTGTLIFRGSIQQYDLKHLSDRSLVRYDNKRSRWTVYEIFGLKTRTGIAISESMMRLKSENIGPLRAGPTGGAFQSLFLEGENNQLVASSDEGEIYCIRTN